MLLFYILKRLHMGFGHKPECVQTVGYKRQWEWGHTSNDTHSLLFLWDSLTESLCFMWEGESCPQNKQVSVCVG